jgi:non-specific serine/threonine protein kinase
MLETIREFGLEQLAARGETEEIARWHAAWCVGMAEAVRRSGQLSGGQGLSMLETEQPNFRAALTWLLEHGEAATALHLAADLAEFWLRRNAYWAEGNAWMVRVLAAHDGAPSAELAEALVGWSMLHWPRDDLSRAKQLLDEAEAVARAAGSAGALAYARLHQGYVANFSRDFDLAVDRAEEALATCTAIRQEFSCNGALWLLARSTLERGEEERAGALYEQLMASGRATGDEVSVANALVGLAILAERRGDLGAALTGFVEATIVCQGFGDWTFASLCLNEAAMTAIALGQPERGVRLWAAADAVRKAVGGAGTMSLRYWPHDKLPPERARAALGAARFAAAREAGAALSLDGAIVVAVELAREMSRADSVRPVGRGGGLTARERDVLRLLVDGLTDKEIAAALAIGSRTVSNHVATIRDKLNAPSRTAAATIAIRDELI